MTPTELTSRVTAWAGLAVAALAVAAGSTGGGAWAVGVLAGGGLGVTHFRALAARVIAVAGAAAPGRWLLGSALRLTASAGACALLFVGGWAHPVAVVLGVSAVPCAVVAAGLAAARREA
jgi:hypothetical protein